MNLLIAVLAFCTVVCARPQGDVAGNGSAPIQISLVSPSSATSKAINGGSVPGEDVPELAFPGAVQSEVPQAGGGSAPSPFPEQIPQAGLISQSADAAIQALSKLQIH